MITLEALKKRRDDLSMTLSVIEVDYDLIKDRLKVIKKEIANIGGAIIELDRMIESL